MSHAATVVVPLLRQDDGWLEQALRSVLDQTVPCELIVVPSLGTPASNLKLVDDLRQEHAKGVVVMASPVDGFPRALNAGFRLAESDRLGILLSDDWLELTAIQESLELSADIVSTGLLSVTADGSRVPRLDRPLDMEGFLRQPTLEAQAAYLTHFLLFRRSVIEAVGGLDETLGDAPGIDDYDLIWTLLERDATVGIASRPLYNYRVHAGERLTLRRQEEQLQTLLRILDKHGVQDSQKTRLLELQTKWLGRPEDEVLPEQSGSARGTYLQDQGSHS